MPTEAPNTLRSRARYKIIDVISQGPIVGLVNGAKSVFLNETPVQSDDDTLNFKNFDITKDLQELPIPDVDGQLVKRNPALFPMSENDVSVGVKVTKDNPVTRTITDLNLDSVKVTLRIPALTKTNTTTGDITGNNINFKIEVKPSDGDFAPIPAAHAWESIYPLYVTPGNATGVRLRADLDGVVSADWQYRRRISGTWGPWITYSVFKAPWNRKYVVTNSIDGLPPGEYQTRVVALGGSVGTTVAYGLLPSPISIEGKTVSPYDVDYLVQLPGNGPWDIRVTRLSDDPATSNIQGDLYWLNYTEQVNSRFSWPNVAGVAITFDAEDFGGSIPTRAYDVMGLIIKIPSNYDPYSRTYSGIWDGTFKEDWTDNPAWIFYDLLTNKRYGLGDNIDASQIDKFALYQIAQYCDELVDAPNGGQEPRYTCSCVINTQSEAYELLTAIASAFRGMIYHSGGVITPVADMPSDPILNVGPANVIDGNFTYQGASRKARHTVARVSWNNPDDGYKLNVELYEDEDAIRKYGYRPIDINAFGCTSRGLARRWGKWAISSDNDAPDTVTYKAGFDHFKLRPGDVINISDPNYSGEQLFGLIADVTDNVSPATHTIKLDRAVTRIAGDTSELQLTLADGTILLLDVAVTGSDVTSDEITVDSAELTAIPLAGASWLLKKGTVEPRQWRVISISEDEPHIYQVTAMLYDPDKYDKVESDLNFAEADFTAFPSGSMPAPTGIAISEFLKQSGSAILSCATVSWTRPNDPRADWFEVQYQLDGEEWRQTEPNLTQLTSIDILNTVPGVYNFRVRAQDTSGLFRSEWATLASQTLQGKNKAPENVTGFTASVEKFGVLLSWNKVSDIDIDYYEIRTGASWAAGTTIGKVKATTFKFEDATTGAYTFWIKALDTQTPANESATAASVSATISAQGTPVVVATSVNGGIQIDISGAVSRGFSHYEIKRRSYPAGTEVTINDNVLTRRFTDTDITTLGYVTQWQYSVRAIDQNAAASAWSDYTTQLSPKMIETLDITANQIVAKDFRTALDVGATVDGVKFTADGIEMWEDGARKVLIPTSGDPEFAGLLTAAAGYIGGWQIFPTYLQSSNIKLDSAGLLQTLDFVSGNKGWKINQDGNAEFNNIRARGAVKTVVFEKDEISVVGGRTLIRPAGVVKDYDYADFINAAGGAYLEDCWDKLNELLGTNYTYVASVFADYDEYYAAELAYYDELCVAMGFNQFACAIKEADYDDATKDAYLTDCWAQLMTLLDLTTATPAIPSMTFAAYETLENGYFDEVATAIDNPPLFEPFINDSDTAIETENADQFNVGDIIRVKDGSANDYWGRISAIVGDILSITGEYGEPFAITAGQTIVNYGIPGSGGILLDGQAPLMDVYTHSGKPWLGADIRLRIGNLNGWGTINDNIYGIAIGQPDGEYLIYDSTSGRLRLNGAIQISEGSGIANFSDAGVLAGLDNIDLSYVTDAGVLAGLDNIDLSYVTDAGALATADNLDDVTDGTTYKRTTANEKTGASRAYSGLDSNNSLITKVLPGAAIGTPLGAGLYFGSDKMGFYSGSDWKTYMDNDGNFYLGGSAAGCGLAWNATTNCLTVCGCITSCEGTIGGWNFNANCLHSNDILINNNGSIYSNNYVAGSAGWCINGAGAAEFSNVTVCGTICSCAGNVGGWTLANGCLSATNAIMYSGAANTARIQLGTGACMGGINSANAGTDVLFWGGDTHANRATAPFRVTAAGDLFATNATICGNIFTNCGTLGFWTISSCGLNYCYRTSYWKYDSNITSRGVEFYHSGTNICGPQTYGCVLIDVARCVCSSFSDAKYAQMHICTYDTSFYAFCSNGRIQASAFCVVSDCNLKTDIQHISILPLLRKMPVTKWRFKNSEDYHVGPMAQDFNSVFQLSHDWKTNLTVGGLDGIALRGVQELDECITSLQCKIQKLECEFAAMRERIS